MSESLSEIAAQPPADQAVRRDSLRRLGLWLCVAVGGAGLVAYLIAALLAKPIADDYWYFTDTRDHGVFGSVLYHLSIYNGRYAPQAVIALGWSVLGLKVVPVACAAFIVLAWVAFVLAAAQFLPFRPDCRVVGPLSVGTLSCFAFVAATPSVFDTFFWLSSAIHYSPPVALLLLNAVLVARLLVAWRARSRLFRGVVAGLACLSVFFAAGFNEIVTAIGIGLLAIALVFDLVTRRWRCRSLLGLLTVAAVAGLVISYFAPGSSNRRALTMAGDPIKNGLESVGSYFTTLGETSLGLVVGLWFVVALATVAATVRPSKRLAAWTAIGAVCLGAGGPVVTSFGVGFAAGGIELRAQLVPTTLLGLGLALVLVACAWLVWGDRAGLASRWLSIAACLAAAIGLGATATDTLGLIRAEALRGQMVLQRDLAVADAVAAGETDITVLPAPILFAPAGATDISFHPGASNHMEAGYRAYMRVPETTTFVVTQQPMGYCLATPPPPRAGAATCQQLGRAN